jgi:mono/diheme cytochrome c family protein
MKVVIRTSFMLACLAAAAVAVNAEQPAAGVYRTNCAPCHGATGEANTPAGKAFKVPSFSSDSVLKASDADLLAIAKNGKGKMPAWHDRLSDDQLRSLVTFIHSLQKKS